MFEIAHTADFFAPGDKVTLGSGEVGVVKAHVVSPTGFHSYRVQLADGRIVGATAPAMRRCASKTTRVRVGGRTFSCRVASTPQEHATGLQGSAPLAPDEGMLFVFDRPRYAAFHMGTVDFPIDIMFIEKGRVARVVRNASPGSTESWAHSPTDMVLEVKAGLAPPEGTRVAAPSLGGDERYEISFPEEVDELSMHPSRFKDRDTPDNAFSEADELDPRSWRDRAPYNPVDDDQYAMRPSASRISDPVDLFIGMLQAMSAEDRPLDWHRNALSPNMMHAVVTYDTLEEWVQNFGLDEEDATEVLAAAASAEGLQVLGDGFVLSGLALIANVAEAPDGSGNVLILWDEYKPMWNGQ